MRLVFVGGVHGVGKSSLCRELAPLLGAKHVTAGTIIREMTGRGPSPSAAKTVLTPEADQEAMLEGLAPLRAQHPRLLLDGHFCLLTADGGVMPIDVGIFRRINPDGLLLVTADPSAVAQRLGARDRGAYTAAGVATLQDAEVAQAEAVAHGLAIPLLRFESGQAAARVASAILAVTGGL